MNLLIVVVAIACIIVLGLRCEHQKPVESEMVFLAGPISGRTDEAGMKEYNVPAVAALKQGYAWVEICSVRGNMSKPPGLYIVGHRHGSIPKDYIGNAME